MNILPSLASDIKAQVNASPLGAINGALYALATLKAGKQPIGPITNKVKLTLALELPRRKTLPKDCKIAMRESSLSEPITLNPTEAVDALCLVLTKIKLGNYHVADLLSITMVLDEHQQENTKCQ
jgi:hypothetical protein